MFDEVGRLLAIAQFFTLQVEAVARGVEGQPPLVCEIIQAPDQGLGAVGHQMIVALVDAHRLEETKQSGQYLLALMLQRVA